MIKNNKSCSLRDYNGMYMPNEEECCFNCGIVQDANK